jgi:pyruvate kinase
MSIAVVEHDDKALQNQRLSGLIEELTAIRADLLAVGGAIRSGVHPDLRHSALNLQHYLTLRQRDLRQLQARLAELGLSSLGRSESHVLASIDAVLTTLRRLAGCHESEVDSDPGLSDFHLGPQRLQRHAEMLLGPVDPQRNARIMVTMPTEAAGDYRLVHELLRGGMDCMRINCAHDDSNAWSAMIDNLQRARQSLGKECRVMMDLAGPKLRTGPIASGAAVIKYRPRRDAWGRVVDRARLWFTSDEQPGEPPTPADACVQVPGEWLAGLALGDSVRFRDARGAHRSIEVLDVTAAGVWLAADRTAYISTATRLHHHSDRGHARQTATVSAVPTRQQVIRLYPGDLLVVTPDESPGRPATFDGSGKLLTPASIGCTLPEVLDYVRVGEEIWFDDGKIGGEVESVRNGCLRVRVRHTGPQGGKLRCDKGINLPGSQLEIPAITARDVQDLEFVARHADMVALSFANTVEDVETLNAHLQRYEDKAPAIVLKIETVNGFQNLPDMLFSAMSAPVCGVMIARGDLAVESGFERMAEVQEEILWLCEAAHVPVIWATQVLETLAKTGAPTRAEITDAAMGHRAECVMLNKGPHIMETVRTLDNILKRMQGHQFKKQSMLRELRMASDRM